MKTHIILTVTAAAVIASCAKQAPAPEPVDYVNTEIGYVSHMLMPVYPTVQLPHSLMRVFPCRYEYTTELLEGLPLLVTGHRSQAGLTIGFPGRRLDFDNEHITPYSYETEIASSSVHSRFAPSHQSAIYELTFREGPATVSFDSEDGEMNVEGDVVKGWCAVGGRTKAYVYAEFEKAPSAAEYTAPGHVSLTFDVSDVRIRYGVSLISTEQAAKNLAREISGFDAAPLMTEGRRIWNEALSRIEVSGGSKNDLTVFYTSYYRTLERPVNISEDGHYWSGEDNRVHRGRWRDDLFRGILLYGVLPRHSRQGRICHRKPSFRKCQNPSRRRRML